MIRTLWARREASLKGVALAKADDPGTSAHTRIPRLARLTQVVLGLCLALIWSAVVIQPAQAAANCFSGSGGERGAWNTQHAYNYAPGGWCIHDPERYNYRLVWQPDGNLVVYNNKTSNTNPRWASNTAGRGARLSFQVDANVVIYDRNNKAIWWTGATRDRNSRTYFYLYLTRINYNFKNQEVVLVEQYDPFIRTYVQGVS